MDLTEREALQETIKMWTWMSEHPEASKDDYFIAMDIKSIPCCECYCCEYTVDEQEHRHCDCCPIWEGAKLSFEGCTHQCSPYYKWKNAVTLKDRAYYANEIVKLAQKALDELNEKE